MSQAVSGTKRSAENNSVSGAKKSRVENLTLRFLLQSKHAGGIIGKTPMGIQSLPSIVTGGQTIKRLRSEYNATVSVPDSSTNERVLSVSATQENAISVVKECLPLFHEPPYPNNSNQDKQAQNEINFLVHSSQVGGIIGRSGAKIKELQETTMAAIKILSNCLPSSTERVVIVGGSEENIISALCKIVDIVQDQPMKGNVAYYDPNQNEWNEGGFNDYGAPGGGGPRGGPGVRGGGRGGMRGGRGGGGGGGGGGFGFGSNSGGYGYGRNEGNYGNFNGSADYASPLGFGDGRETGESQTNQVTIPNDVAGAIIGKGGERIRNIRQRSGADIKIEDPQPGKQDRVITICGFQDQIQYAQFLMQQSIRQHSHKK